VPTWLQFQQRLVGKTTKEFLKVVDWSIDILTIDNLIEANFASRLGIHGDMVEMKSVKDVLYLGANLKNQVAILKSKQEKAEAEIWKLKEQAKEKQEKEIKHAATGCMDIGKMLEPKQS